MPTPVYLVTIEGVDISPLLESFALTQTANGIDTLDCAWEDEGNGSPIFRPNDGDEILFYEDGVKIFGGYITHTRERGLGGPAVPGIVTYVTAQDYGSVTQRIYVNETLNGGSPAVTLEDFLNTLVSDYLGPNYGITLHPSQATGIDLPAVRFDYITAEAVLNQLAEITGWLWEVDAEKRLRMYAPGDIAAPFDIDEDDLPAKWTDDVEVERRRGDRYANYVRVLAEKVVETGRTETFVADGVGTDYSPSYTILGVSQGVVRVTNVPGVDPDDQRWETVNALGDTNEAIWKYDIANNEITRTGELSDGPLPSGAIIDFTFDGEFQASVVAQDAGEIATYGRWEHVERPSGITDAQTAQDLADAILAERLASSELVATYHTREVGLLPGQQQVLVSEKRQLSGNFLIMSVMMRPDAGGDALVRDVTASKSSSPANKWQQTWKDFLGDEQNTTNIESTTESAVGGVKPAGLDRYVQHNRLGAFGATRQHLHDHDYGGDTYGFNNTPATVAIGVEDSTGNRLALALFNAAAGKDKALTALLGDVGDVYIDANGPVFEIRSHDSGAVVDLAGHFTLNVVNEFTQFAQLRTIAEAFGLSLKSARRTTSFTVDSGAVPVSVELCDTTSGSITATLPALTASSATTGTNNHRLLWFKNLGANSLILDGNGSEVLFDGVSSATTLTVPAGAAVLIQSRTGTGAGWYVLASHGMSSSLAAHETSHREGGSDELKLDDLGIPDDNTDLNASTTRHGLLSKLSGNSNEFMDGTGNWSDPGTGSGTGNVTDTTAFGSEPSGSPGPSAGDLVFYNNSFYVSRFTGSAWGPWGPIFPMTQPVDGDFSWVNQGGASVDASLGGIYLLAPATAGDSLRVRVKTAPSTPYVITACFLPAIHAANNSGTAVENAAFGLIFRESGTGELATFGLQFVSGQVQPIVVVQKFNSATSFNSGYNGGTTRRYPASPLFLRIADNGTNRMCSISTDGQHFIQVHTVGRTDFLTADQVGFYAHAGNSSNDCGVNLLSWKET